MKFFEKYPLL